MADADAISESTLTIVPITWLDTDGTRKVFKAPRTYGGTESDESTIGYVDQYEWGASVPPSVGAIITLVRLDAEGNFPTLDPPYMPLSYIKQLPGGVTYDLRRDRTTTSRINVNGITGNDSPMPAPPQSRTDVALTGTIGAVTYVLTAGDGGSDAWSTGGMVQLGHIDIALGADSNKVRFVGISGSMAGLEMTATYVHQSKADTYDSWIQAGMDKAKIGADRRGGIIAQPRTVNDRDAYGLSVGRQFGAGTTITLGWSRLRDRALTDAAGQFAGTKRWDLDITHDLGGGAELYASLQQERRTEFAGRYNIKTPVIQDGAANRKLPISSVPVIDKSKVTTIELGVTMKF